MFQHRKRSVHNRSRSYKPTVDELEPRILLAWTALGPRPQSGWPVPNSIFAQDVAGRVTSLGYSVNFDGMNHNAIIMGTAGGGIWIHAEGLVPFNWRPITENLVDWNGNPIADPRFLAGAKAIGAVAVDPNNSRIIYAGTGEANYSDSRYGAGILKSTDAGATWTLLTGLAPNQSDFYRHSISRIFVDPTNSDYVYAAVVLSNEGADFANPNYRTFDGVYESPNRGRTWTRLWNGGPNAPIIVTDLDFTIVGAGANRQINVFAAVSNPYTGTPSAGAGYHDGTGKGIYRGTFTINPTTFARENWTFNQVMIEPTSRRISLTANRGVGQNQIVYEATAGVNGQLADVQKTTNNGQNWQSVAPTNLQRTALGNIGWYALTIAMDLTNPNLVYVGSQGETPLNRRHVGGGLLQTVNGGRLGPRLMGPRRLGSAELVGESRQGAILSPTPTTMPFSCSPIAGDEDFTTGPTEEF